MQNSIADNVLALALFVVGVVLLTDPFVGFSEFLPDGVFELIAGFLLLGLGLVLFWTRAGTAET